MRKIKAYSIDEIRALHLMRDGDWYQISNRTDEAYSLVDNDVAEMLLERGVAVRHPQSFSYIRLLQRICKQLQSYV